MSRFVECDGCISGIFFKGLSEVGGIFGSGTGGKNKSWIPRRSFYKCSDISTLTYYSEERLIVPAERRPREGAGVNRLGRMMQMFQAQVVEQGEANAPRELEEEFDDIPAVYAPAGWYFSVGVLQNDEFHIAREEDGERIAHTVESDPIAEAIQRLADEIAFKPSTLPGSEVSAAATRNAELFSRPK